MSPQFVIKSRLSVNEIPHAGFTTVVHMCEGDEQIECRSHPSHCGADEEVQLTGFIPSITDLSCSSKIWMADRSSVPLVRFNAETRRTQRFAEKTNKVMDKFQFSKIVKRFVTVIF
jgi:hypothetical protein